MTVPLGASAAAALPVRRWSSAGPVLPDVPRSAGGVNAWTATSVDVGTGAAPIRAGRVDGSRTARRRDTAEVLDGASAHGLQIDPAPGWVGVGEDAWWHEDPAVTATVRAHVQHDADGRALLAVLRAPTPDDLGTPDVIELPEGLADGLLVVRRQVLDGALVLRVDLARRAWDTEVLVSAVLPDPSVADDAVAALVRLLAAIGPGHDRLTA